MVNASNPGKVVVDKITITSFDGSKSRDITRLCSQIDIWEDVRKPSMIVDVFVADAIGLVTSFPIVAEEKLEIILSTPSGTSLTPLKLVVTGITDFQFDEQGNASGYTLICSGEEVWADALESIMKGYMTTVDGIVRDMVMSQLKSKKMVFAEPAKGISQFVTPRMSPFETIDMLRKRAVSATNPGSHYLFFENKKGFVFKTIEQLFKEGASQIVSKKRTFHRSMVDVADSKLNIENSAAWRSLIAMHNTQRYNSAERVASGALYNTTYKFDIPTKTLTKIEFSFQQKGSSFTLGDASGIVPSTPAFMQKYGSKNAVAFFVPTDSTKGENFLAENLGAKVAYDTLINQHSVLAETYGDYELCAGDVVKLSVPLQQGTTEQMIKEDPYLSGTYFITSLRHMISVGPSATYHMSMELIKGNYLSTSV